MFIDMSVDIFINMSTAMFIDISVDIVIGISINIFIDMFIVILTGKEEGGRKEWTSS